MKYEDRTFRKGLWIEDRKTWYMYDSSSQQYTYYCPYDSSNQDCSYD